MEVDDLAMFDKAVSGLVARFDGHRLTDALDGVGWLDILAEDPAAGVPAVFRAQGEAVVWSSGLHDALGAHLAQLGHDAPLQATAVVVPLPRSHVAGRRIGNDITINGLLLGARPTTEWLVATVANVDGQLSVLRIQMRDTELSSRGGLDPAIEVQRVTAGTDASSLLADGDLAGSWWTASVALGRRALSHQLCGVLSSMLDSARSHAIERHQFGHPIGSFQAVRHKLAEAYVALAGAQAMADMAWESDDVELAAMTAKIAAGRACATVGAHAQQVLAGVGFTAEHPFHHAMKRAVLIDRLLGSADDLTVMAGHDLVTRGLAPRLVEL
jgi:hypothetical protein